MLDFAANGDLFQKIKRIREAKTSGDNSEQTYIEESEIWSILIQIMRGLLCLHSNDIVHRDIKSANIFLYDDGVVKIGDLNVSKIVKGGLFFTQTGTPYYASPEVWRDQPYNSKSDVWSLGCIAYELMAHSPPFKAENMAALYKTIIRGKVPKIVSDYEYSDDIKDLVKLMLKVDYNLRPSIKTILEYPIVQEMESTYLSDKLNEGAVWIDMK